jgi:hypothetical protein
MVTEVISLTREVGTLIMKKCELCDRTEKDTKIISSNGQLLCQRCYQRKRRNKKIYPLPSYGEVKYNEEGNPICHICGESHSKLLAHVWQIHHLNEKEYKKQFGLELYNSIMSEKSKAIARQRALEHKEIVIDENLVNKGQNTRFKKGSIGRTKDKVSEQTRKKLILNRIPSLQRWNKGRKKEND